MLLPALIPHVISVPLCNISDFKLEILSRSCYSFFHGPTPVCHENPSPALVHRRHAVRRNGDQLHRPPNALDCRPRTHKRTAYFASRVRHILQAFLLAYTVMYLGSGFLVDRWGTRSRSPSLWRGGRSATCCTPSREPHWGWASSDCLLGLGEPGNFMASFKAISEWYPAEGEGVCQWTGECRCRGGSHYRGAPGCLDDHPLWVARLLRHHRVLWVCSGSFRGFGSTVCRRNTRISALTSWPISAVPPAWSHDRPPA